MKNELTAKRIQLALSNSNMKPQELANKSGIGKSSISQYVNGSHIPGNISAEKIGNILQVNPLWLMGFDVPMERRNNDATEETVPKIIQYYNQLNDTGKHVAMERVKELTEVPRYTLDVKAAHNDYESEPGEIEKMREDLSKLKKPD